ncbi:hypothetical protein P5V15_004099 [Pogonomyrmex californicus]
MLIHGIGVSKFPCHKCGRSYKNKGSLKRHLNDECGKDPQYICPICERGFKQKANYQRHDATVHGFPGISRGNRVAIKGNLKLSSTTEPLWSPFLKIRRTEQP